MPSLDDLKKRIKSVKSTQKITKAMKMVAAAKLRKAQDSAEKGRPYSQKMQNIIFNLITSINDPQNAPKLLVGNGKDKIYLCLVLTADRGLCGGFNSNICKLAKINFKKIALFGLGPIVLIGIGLGVGAFLFMPTQTPVEQVEELIEKKLQQAGQLPSAEGEEEAAAEPEKVYKDTPSTDTFVTSYYTFPDNFTTNLKGSKAFLQVSVGVSTQYDETVIENVEMHQLALRSEVLGVVSEFTVEEVEGKLGRDDLADGIKNAINSRLEELEGFGGVEGVYFTAFVLQ